MLTIQGNEQGSRFCDGLTRRDFIKIGGLAMGGMSLTDMLAAEAKAGIRKNHKAIIMVFLPGGPPHQDMFDLKPEAPSEIRGEFKPIKTNVSGIEICEHMPRLAKMMDKCTLIRSMADCDPGHDAFQCLTGRSHQLRVQCAKRHLPIVGDQTYGDFPRNRDFAKRTGLLAEIDAYARGKDSRVVQVMASLAAEWQAVQIIRGDGGRVADLRPLVRLDVSVVVEQDGRRERLPARTVVWAAGVAASPPMPARNP